MKRIFVVLISLIAFPLYAEYLGADAIKWIGHHSSLVNLILSRQDIATGLPVTLLAWVLFSFAFISTLVLMSLLTALGLTLIWEMLISTLRKANGSTPAA